jgi:hypothetical protein
VLCTCRWILSQAGVLSKDPYEMSDFIALYLIRTDQMVECVRSELKSSIIVYLTTLLVTLRRDFKWYDDGWMVNWKGCYWNWPWPDLKVLFWCLLGMTEENHENTQRGLSPSRDLNLESIEFKAEWMLGYVTVFGSSESRQRPIIMLHFLVPILFTF